MSCIEILCTCMTWLSLLWDLAHLHLGHDSLICETWRIYKCDMAHWYVYKCARFIWILPSVRVIRPVHTCDMIHSCVWGDSCMCVTSHPYVWHGSSICVTWLIHTCDLTHSCVRHDSCICVTWHIHMLQTNVWHNKCVTRRCVVWHN